MKILVYGSSGYIGTELIRQLKEREIDYRTEPGSQMTGATGQWMYQTLRNRILLDKPDVIINCAAYVGKNSISDCELRKDRTISANVILPQMLMNICVENKIVLGHFSSGCIYDGYPPIGWCEKSEPNLAFYHNNCSFYTGTKVLAEQSLEMMKNKYVWRIRLPFDENHNNRNYFSKLLKYENLVNAQNSISHKKELVNAVIDCIVKKVPYGTYHVTNPGTISAKEIIELMRVYWGNIPQLRKTFKYLTVEEYDKISKIPISNNHLNTDKLLKEGIYMRPVKRAVEETLNEWRW